jgi:hypothetical protein
MTIGQTRALEACPVCGERSFADVYPATFDNGREKAVPFFLTDRTLAVHGRTVRCNVCTHSYSHAAIRNRSLLSAFTAQSPFRDTFGGSPSILCALHHSVSPSMLEL